ncbi:UDP-N-acetylglucosamine 1-carboxyvinyltransferase [Melghirimyces algeriensis]|uniref:UDP-N-acetylglucosamine 1-carboxyvinyltransferase n=1 Tax=Melghirimyces algeriensis TaxID=910412 RepID=A0A521D7F8_9BACL|nr:UDP-N-acetylglucosamine 1-carboxyvinyltransferase [Melghirimyces algeriensis]SMO67624.1 UDP-N-acetylglucosamine 1-carboxyvinyltransferase [Melghirimyces algeriensis]
MGKLMIKGGRPLYGRISASGAKNSAVALIPAAILAESPTTIENMPWIRDVELLTNLLQDLGGACQREKDRLLIDPKGMKRTAIVAETKREFQVFTYFIGAMLGRFGEILIYLPTESPIDFHSKNLHLKGLKALGAQLTQTEQTIHLKVPCLRGARIYLDEPDMGATINIMLAAVKANGVTTIQNAAKEPEIIDVATMLNSMGAQIKGAGTDVIRIHGLQSLKGCLHTVIPDRIEVGTYMIAAAATSGDVTLEQVIPRHLEAVSAKLREMGVQVQEKDENLRVFGADRYRSIDIKTLPYPGFPTDLQQPFSSLLTKVDGISLISDPLSPSRFDHVEELCRMGASIHVEGRRAMIRGATPLYGTVVQIPDLRGGAALVVAALMAEGVTSLLNAEQLNQGYEALHHKLQSLGAQVWWQ